MGAEVRAEVGAVDYRQPDERRADEVQEDHAPCILPFPDQCDDRGRRQILRDSQLGEKIVRRIDMLGDTKVSKTDTKDEIQVEGTDIELVGRSAALINQSRAVKKKDIRKFLDGVYVAAYGAGDEMKSKI